MINRIRRILLILVATSGITTATDLTAHAGVVLGNHCEPTVP